MKTFNLKKTLANTISPEPIFILLSKGQILKQVSVSPYSALSPKHVRISFVSRQKQIRDTLELILADGVVYFSSGPLSTPLLWQGNLVIDEDSTLQIAVESDLTTTQIYSISWGVE